jgi:transposase InsO family protein
MSKETETTKNDALVAQFRFAMIAPVIQGLFPDVSATAYYKRVTEHPLTLPNGTVVQYSYKTLEKWKSLYLRGGLDALIPTTRSDKGISRALNDEAINEIYRVKQEHPRMNATQIHDYLIRESFLSASVSVDSVQRFVKNNDLKSARDPNLRDRKAYEEDEFGKIWQADTCYLPYITEDGKTRRVYCIMIIDDHSRLLVGGELFYNDNAYNFQKVLKQAVSTYGIPDKLYVDNGCSYSNEQLSMICVSLGVLLLHTKIRDGASKGKVERHFRTLKERWLYTLDISKITSLAQFNEMLKDYMRSTTRHFTAELMQLLWNASTIQRIILSVRNLANGLMIVSITALLVKSARILRLPLTTSATMFQCSSSLPRWISVFFLMTWMPHIS